MIDRYDIKRHVQLRGRNAQAETVTWFLDSLRDGPFADGGYPKYWVTSDGDVLSYKACKANCGRIARAIREQSRDGWRVTCSGINWEDADMVCSHTGERIPSAYS